MTLVPVPSLALDVLLHADESRAHGHEERRARTEIREARMEHSRRRVGCADLRGSVLECRTCRANPCPHGHHGGI